MKNRFGWRDKQPEEENVSKAQPIVVRFHDSKESIYIGDKEGFEKIDKE